jgi:hypothetical protein
MQRFRRLRNLVLIPYYGNFAVRLSHMYYAWRSTAPRPLSRRHLYCR